ncbi:hypothetical protein [Iodidimonas sp. SYSU 1G8]|uniref:hypothetical protein n=1 Tax=Iodidimonas sp. SYSU 1G8 TaxID=3133967 RepID=UPI0031FF1227
MKRIWIAIGAVLLASCQSHGASTETARTDTSRDAAERDRKIDAVQEQIRNMQH